MFNRTHKSGFGERGGVWLIELEADLPDGDNTDNNTNINTSVPSTVEWTDLEAKAFSNARGDGLEQDPELIALNVVHVNARQAIGEGTLRLRGTANDALHTILTSSVVDFTYYTETGKKELKIPLFSNPAPHTQHVTR